MSESIEGLPIMHTVLSREAEHFKDNADAIEAGAVAADMKAEYIPPLGQDATDEDARHAGEIHAITARQGNERNSVLKVDPEEWREGAEKAVREGGRLLVLRSAESGPAPYDWHGRMNSFWEAFESAGGKID